MGNKNKPKPPSGADATRAKDTASTSRHRPSTVAGAPQTPLPSSGSLVSLPAALTPAKGRRTTNSLLLTSAAPRSKAWWTTMGVLGVILLSAGLGLFIWYWFIGYVTTVAGDGQAGYRDGAAWQARMFNPKGLTINSKGTLYVADSANHCIRKITHSGNVTTFAGSGYQGHRDGHALHAMFSQPAGITLDAKGNLYIADTGNHRIRKIDTKGVVSTVAGDGIPGNQDGAAHSARFRAPYGLAIDAKGTIFVADTGNHRIRTIDTKGVVSTLAGSIEGFQDSQGDLAQFHAPTDIVLHPNGVLYIADQQNHRIRTLNRKGQAGSFVGNGQIGARDGHGYFATFYRPTGLTIGRQGELYVTDSYNHRIRRITMHGDVTTIAGNGDAGMRNGPPSWSSFTWPQHLALGPRGNLYVVEWGNDSVRKVALKLFR